MAQLPPELRFSFRYPTSEQLGFDENRTEPELAEILGTLSVYDCLGLVGRLSSWLYVNPRSPAPAGQAALVAWVSGFDSGWNARLTSALKDGFTPIFPQQLAHLARLAVRYASRARARDYHNDYDRQALLACLFGVADLFHDPALDLRDPTDKLQWALRHTGIGQRRERLTLWSSYFEVLCKIWPSATENESRAPNEAFERYAGMSIQRFMAAGMSFSAAFAVPGENGSPGRYALNPQEYFAETKLTEPDWQAFLRTSASDVDDLADRLARDEHTFGPTQFGALAFEQTPLVSAPDGRVYLVSLESLERRVTEGVLHILAEGAVEEGGEREDYTAPFGAAFQAWAEACFRRANRHLEAPPTIIADTRYGTKRAPKYTPDVVLKHPRSLVAIEIVSGPLQIRTVTHGDLEAFDRDVSKLIIKKATQLTKRIDEFLAGDAVELEIDPDEIKRIWPVILMATSFPQHPMIGPLIRQRLKREGLLQQRSVGTLAIVTAEDLAAAEGAMEEGTPLVELLREWKRTRATGDFAFKNFLIFRERKQRRPPAKHHQDMYGEAFRAMVGEVLDDAGVQEALPRPEPAP